MNNDTDGYAVYSCQSLIDWLVIVRESLITIPRNPQLVRYAGHITATRCSKAIAI